MNSNQQNNLNNLIKAIEKMDVKKIEKLAKKINREVSNFYGFDVDLFINKQNKNE